VSIFCNSADRSIDRLLPTATTWLTFRLFPTFYRYPADDQCVLATILEVSSLFLKLLPFSLFPRPYRGLSLPAASNFFSFSSPQRFLRLVCVWEMHAVYKLHAVIVSVCLLLLFPPLTPRRMLRSYRRVLGSRGTRTRMSKWISLTCPKRAAKQRRSNNLHFIFRRLVASHYAVVVFLGPLSSFVPRRSNPKRFVECQFNGLEIVIIIITDIAVLVLVFLLAYLFPALFAASHCLVIVLLTFYD